MTDSVTRAWNKIVKRGRPSDKDMRDLRYVDPLTDEVKKQIAERIQEKLQEKLAQDGGSGKIEREGSTVLAGQVTSSLRPAVDIKVRPVGYHAGVLEFEVVLPENSLYRTNKSDFHKPFEALGMKCGEAIHALEGVKAMYSKDLGEQYHFVTGWENPRVVVDAKKFLKTIGLEGLNLEANKHTSRLGRAEEKGLEYTKYLERRGQEGPSK